MPSANKPTPPPQKTEAEEFERIPGLFRRWELQTLLAPGCDYRVERQGTDAVGTLLFAVYRRPIRQEVS
jgi:hypothetical protein